MLYLAETVLLAVLAHLPPDAERALLEGKLIGVSSRPAQGIYPMPESILAPANLRGYESEEVEYEGRKVITSRPASSNPDLWGVWIRLSERGNYIEYQFVSLTKERGSVAGVGAGQGRLSLRQNPGRMSFHLAPYVRDHAWAKFWHEWATPQKEWNTRVPEQGLTQRDDRPKLNLNQDADPETSRRVNVADLLELFAWTTRIPVIAESLRTEVLFMTADLEASVMSPRVLLRWLSEYGWFRLEEGGYLLYRPQYYWSRRLVELPEDWLRPLEQRFQSQGWLDLEDYITLVGRMNALQASYYEREPISYLTSETVLSVRFPFYVVSLNMPALRFLASLTPQQRRLARNGDWISVNQLTPAQRQRFYEALGERFPPPEALFSEPIGNYNYSDLREMAILGAAEVRRTEEAPVEAPGFRLNFVPDALQAYQVFSSSYSYSFHPLIVGKVSDPALAAEMARWELEQIRERMASNPDSRLYAVRIQGYILELQAPPSQRKKYPLIQRRTIPIDLRTLESQLTQGENRENPQAEQR